MSNVYSRLLIEPITVEHFLENALDYDINDNFDIVTGIVQNENILKDIDSSSPTLNSIKYRHPKYRKDNDRWHLRNQIVSELFNNKRIENDDKITLGNGGAQPISDVLMNKEAIIIIGLPASGKSTIANVIADSLGAYILDSDYAKRKFPEYQNYLIGATIVHEESDSLIFGFKDSSTKSKEFKSLFDLCLVSNCNIVIPKIGHNHISIAKFAETLKNSYGYKVHLVLVSLDRKKSTVRALERYRKSKRYIPLGLIFDGYGNEPILSYYRLKNNYNSNFESVGKVSTDTELGEKAIVVEFTEKSPVRNL